MRNFGGYAYYQYRLNTRFNVNVNLNGRYIKNQLGDQSNEGFSYYASIGSTVTMWKGSSFNASAYYSSPSIGLYGESNSSYYYMFGLSQRFLKDKLTVRVSVTNPFNYSRTYKSDMSSENFIRHSESMMVMRRISIYAGFRFGKMQTQVKKTRRSISNDDRMGSSGGGEGAPAAQ